LSTGPAKVLGIPSVGIAVGNEANMTILDLKKEWTVDPLKFQSKGRNTPFAGFKVKGKAVATIVSGRVLYSEL